MYPKCVEIMTFVQCESSKRLDLWVIKEWGRRLGPLENNLENTSDDLGSIHHHTADGTVQPERKRSPEPAVLAPHLDLAFQN